jgi:UDP-glucose 4-epimerase
MTVLVTGGTGFIGSYLLRRLAKNGERVIAYDLAPQTKTIRDILNMVTVVKGDIQDIRYLLQVLKEHDVDTIIHTAALLIAESQKNPSMAIRINMEGIINILEVARLTDSRKIVFTSSQAVYGVTEEIPIDENYPKNPNTVYGITKLASELFGLNYHENYGLDFVALRFPLVYGFGRVRGFGIINELIEKPFVGLPAEISHGGSQKYEPLYVKDAVNALYLAMHARNLKNRIFNIGSQEMLYLREIADIVKKFIPSAVFKIGSGYNIAYCTRGPLSIEKARRELGYKPQYKIDSGIQDYIECMRQSSVPHISSS